MNPLILLVLVFVLRGKRTRTPYIWSLPSIPQISVPKLSMGDSTYFDTFRMELLLDRLRNVTEALDQMNRFSQMEMGNGDFGGMMERLETSLDIAKTFLSNTKAERQLQQLSGIVETMRGLGDPSALMAAAGPLLSAVGNGENGRMMIENDEK